MHLGPLLGCADSDPPQGLDAVAEPAFDGPDEPAPEPAPVIVEPELAGPEPLVVPPGPEAEPQPVESAPTYVARLSRMQVRGCLDEQLVKRVGRTQRRTLSKCARRGQGEVDVRYLVGPQGDVLAATAVTSSAPPRATRCVTEAIRTWKFPKPKGSSVEVIQRVELRRDSR